MAAEERAERAEAENKRLREALEDIRSRSSMNMAMRPDPVALTAELGNIHQIADAALAQPKRRPYNASGSLSEYGIFPECDTAPAAQAPAADADALDAARYRRLESD